MKKLMLFFIGCLVAHGSVNAMGGDLIGAIINKNLPAVNGLLLQSDRFNINEPITGSLTYLHLAARHGTPAIVATLIAAGADANQGMNGSTPLHLAAFSGREDNALILIVAGGAHVDQQDDDGVTPLHEAVRERHMPAIQVLINAHANPNLRDKWGKTPMDYLYEGELDVTDLQKRGYSRF